MTKNQFEFRLKSAFEQYATIDLVRRECFGSLLQGFVGIKSGEDAHIVPFNCSISQENQVIEMIWNRHKDFIEESDFVGVSLVQHYIHYTNIEEIRNAAIHNNGNP